MTNLFDIFTSVCTGWVELNDVRYHRRQFHQVYRRLLRQRQHIIQKRTQNTVIIHVEPKNIKTKQQMTDRQTDRQTDNQYQGVRFYLCLQTLFDVARPNSA